MRICVSHQTTYRYDAPAGSVIQMLRLTPRNHDGQHVARWRIDVSADCRLDQHEDAFGNIAHALTADGPFSELNVLVEREVETRDTESVVRGYLRRNDGVTEQIAGDACAEAFVPDLGGVAVDTANGSCATDAHVRVAVGLDYLGAAPVRGTRYVGAGETLAVNLRVEQAAWQMQN